jgi:site-specific recombinase XerD
VLNLYRRHAPECPHEAKGIGYTKCSCPIWAYGDVEGKRVRQSMKTRDWARANRRLSRMDSPAAGPMKPIKEAIGEFLEAGRDLAPATLRKYRRTLGNLRELAEKRGLAFMSDVNLEMADAFRASRKISALTWMKELQILRHFFRFCTDRNWMAENPARLLPTPKNLKPTPIEPYTPEEMVRILAACQGIGRGSYERLRARAMVLLLRYTALRISDVATLARDRIRGGEIHLYTTKSGKPVRLPIPGDLVAALAILPAPRAAGPDCPYFFWSGHGGREAMKRDATRTLAVVFKASGVQGAHAHRFRHTLATELLTMGGSIQEAADILGNTPAIILKHYAKWSTGRQERISQLMQSVFGRVQNVYSDEKQPVTN